MHYHPCRQVFAFLGVVQTGSSFFIPPLNFFIITNCFCAVSHPVLRQEKKKSPSPGWWFQLNVALRPTAFLQIFNKGLSFREVFHLFQIRLCIRNQRIAASQISLVAIYYIRCQVGTSIKDHVPPGRIREEGDHGRRRARREDWSLLYANMQCS